MLFSGLSLSLGAGEALEVRAPNGVGKSSLIRLLAGLARPFAGSVERGGSIGLLDERPALDEHLELGKALAFWARLDDHNAALEKLGIDGLLDVPVRYLSTGQRKRAALARLLGQQADIWLLDEPLNGLDTDAVALTEGLVAQHCASGGIALVASHQPMQLPGNARLNLAQLAQ